MNDFFKKLLEEKKKENKKKESPKVVRAYFDSNGVDLICVWSDGSRTKYQEDEKDWRRLPRKRKVGTVTRSMLDKIAKFIRVHKLPYTNN
jgi:hypothetical protein